MNIIVVVVFFCNQFQPSRTILVFGVEFYTLDLDTLKSSGKFD